MNINTLPDLCLRTIFSHLALSDQIRLHLVCPRWSALQAQVTSTLKSLTIFIGVAEEHPNPWTLITRSHLNLKFVDSTQSTNEDSLNFTKLTANLVNHLMHLFPSIGSITIGIRLSVVPNMDHLLELLKHWSPELKTLKLYCYYHFDESSKDIMALFGQLAEQVFSLIRMINRDCLTLECLFLDVQDEIYDQFGNVGATRQVDKLDLVCLKWLKEFRFSSCDQFGDFINESLKKYGSANEELKRILIANEYYRDDIAAQFVDHPTLARKFIAFPRSSPGQSSRHFGPFLTTFPSLSHLSLNYATPTLAQFTTNLSPLAQLEYLNIFIKSNLRDYDETPSYDLHELSSVKYLTLALRSFGYTELQSRHWGKIFPSVELIELKLYHTTEQPEDEQFELFCLKRLLEPVLKQCSKLKRIVTVDFYRKGSESNLVNYQGNVQGDTKEWRVEQLL